MTSTGGASSTGTKRANASSSSFSPESHRAGLWSADPTAVGVDVRQMGFTRGNDPDKRAGSVPAR